MGRDSRSDFCYCGYYLGRASCAVQKLAQVSHGPSLDNKELVYGWHIHTISVFDLCIQAGTY